MPKHQMIIDDKSHEYSLPHAIYNVDEIKDINETHVDTKGFIDNLAYHTVKFIRVFFDRISGYNEQHMEIRQWYMRVCFLETIAGIPGMVGGVVRHLKSLRLMRKDHGWIHHLLLEAENERMHLFIFLNLYNPSKSFRGLVILMQGIFFNFFFIAYLISPKFCHRFVGYLEEQAVHTYTILLDHLDRDLKYYGDLSAPKEAIE